MTLPPLPVFGAVFEVVSGATFEDVFADVFEARPLPCFFEYHNAAPPADNTNTAPPPISNIVVVLPPSSPPVDAAELSDAVESVEA